MSPVQRWQIFMVRRSMKIWMFSLCFLAYVTLPQVFPDIWWAGAIPAGVALSYFAISNLIEAREVRREIFAREENQESPDPPESGKAERQ